MGHMKNLLITIYGGGDDAIAAACELAGLVKERRAYEDTMRATSDITDIVTVLRGVGFAAVPPAAGDSASLLHYCVTHAADEIERLRADWPEQLKAAHSEIERLRLLSQNGDCPASDNAANRDNTPAANATPSEGSEHDGCTLTDAEREAVERVSVAYGLLPTAGAREVSATLRGLLERME